MPVTSMRAARKATHANRYEPFKFANALGNSLFHGIGKSLDTLVPEPRAPGPSDPDSLRRVGALVILADQEPKQNLGLLFSGSSFVLGFQAGDSIFVFGTPRMKWILQLIYRMRARIKYRPDFIHRVYNDAKNPIAQLGLAGAARTGNVMNHLRPQAIRVDARGQL